MNNCFDEDTFEFDETAFNRLAELLALYKGCTVHYSYRMPITGGTITKCTDGILAEVTNRRFLIETEWDMKCRWWKDIDKNDILIVKKPNKPPLYIFFKDYANTTTSKNYNNLDTDMLMRDFSNYDKGKHVSYWHMTEDRKLIQVNGNLVYVDDVRFVIESKVNHCLYAFMFSEINPDIDEYKRTLVNGNVATLDWNEFRDTSYILIKLQPLPDKTIDRYISDILNSKLTQQILEDGKMYAVLTNNFYAEADVDILKKYINFKVLGSLIKDNNDWYIKIQILDNMPLYTIDLLKGGNVRAVPHYVDRVDKVPYIESFQLITLE